MPLTLPNGQTFFVPGVFAVTQVVNESGTDVPVFNVGVIIGKQQKGVPYTQGIQNGSVPPVMTADQFILPFTNSADLAAEGGDSGDNDILTMFGYAKAQGAGTVFTLNVNPLTALSGVAINNNAGTPALSLTAKSVGFGAEANDIQLTIASSIHTIVPPMKETFFTADSLTTDTTVHVGNAGKYQAGASVYATDNSATAPIPLTVLSVDPVNNTVTFTTTVGTALTKAHYARLFMLNSAGAVTSSALTDSNALTSFYSNNGILTAAVVAGVTPPTTLAATFLGTVAGATQATSPTATSTDWSAIANNFQRWNTEFAIINQVYIRYLLLGTSDSTNHAAFSALATSMAGINKPIVCISGCALGDINLTSSDASYPIKRAKALNSDKFILAESGLDGYAAYQSLAAEAFGIKLATAVNHNMTRDNIVATTAEKAYDTYDTGFTTHTQAGLLTIEMTKTGYKVGMAVNTYQNQTNTFDPDAKESYLQANRDVADFCLRTDMDNLDQFAGGDNVTSEKVASVMMNTGNTLVGQFQYISKYTIISITKQGNGWIATRRVYIDSPTDQIGLINEIYVNS